MASVADGPVALVETPQSRNSKSSPIRELFLSGPGTVTAVASYTSLDILLF